MNQVQLVLEATFEHMPVVNKVLVEAVDMIEEVGNKAK